MPLYKFGKKDIFRNQIKTHSDCNFFIFGGSVYYNNESPISGSHTSSVPHVPTGYINLYELNVDRQAGNLIYPFTTKEGSLNAFKTVSKSEFNSFQYGDTITGSYPMSASITRERFAEGASIISGDVKKPHLEALKTTFDYYTPLSRHYEYSSSLGNKSNDELTLLSIPSIYYGSSIKKGSVNMKIYITGTLAGELKDEKENGELVQVGPIGSTGSGSVAGVVLYNEGFMALTGAWALDAGHTEKYRGAGNSALNPAWKFYGAGMPVSGQDSDVWTADDFTGDVVLQNTSYSLSFQTTNYTQVVTMMAHAPRGMLNHSNNPTFVEYGQSLTSSTNSRNYFESKTIAIKNIVSGAYSPQSASFEKQTYISKIGIYDEDRNLIAIAKVATPVKKTEDRDFTFKLKLDI
jgi:hypothetical protein